MPSMTQAEFNALMDAYLAQKAEGYYTSKYSGEEIDALLDLVSGEGGSGFIAYGAAALEDGAPLPTGTIYVQYE